MHQGIVPRNSHLGLLLSDPLRFVAIYRVPLFLLLVGAFFDGLTTYRFLLIYGPEVEVHPVQRIVFMHLPPLPGVVLAKSAQVVIAIFLAAWWQPWCKYLMLVTAALYGLAAVSNHLVWL